MQRRQWIPALIMAAGVATAGGLVYAQQSGVIPNDALTALTKARITLAQAVSVAEQHVGGRASQAELENENGHLVYAVEVSDNTRTMDVKVDATNGTVLSAEADHEDIRSENGKDEQDDD
jgi:uncharacterized membrane protein YkoI